jgi:hypothetical protein
MPSSHEAVLARIESLYRMLFEHSGYGEMGIEIRFLRKHEKEVLIRCGKQYRFVVPCDASFADNPSLGEYASKKMGAAPGADLNRNGEQ